MNKNFKIYLPFIFAIVLALGVLIGLNLNFDQKGNSSEKKFFSIGFDRYDKLTDITNYIYESYVDSISRQELTEDAVRSLLQNLDPHSSYIPASAFAEMNDPLMGSFEGIGVEFNMLTDTVVIVNPLSGGPSEKVGIMPGDRIIKVEGENIAGVNLPTTDVIRLLKGPKGTKVTVSVMRRSVDDLLDFTITRDKIPSYSLDVAYMIDELVGYIKLGKFSATTHQEFRMALERLKREGMQQMVLDLRGNGGGFLDAAIQLADEFLSPDQLMVYTDGRSRPRNYAYSRRNGGFETQPLVILIDEWSASASEIIAGAVQDHDRGVVIGRRSFGKGLVQEQIQLGDGSAIRLTVARYYTPSGRSIQKPYDNGSDEYFANFVQRIMDGETDDMDTIKNVDSLRFETTKGRIVFGGGGITPDIIVPLQSEERSSFFNLLINRGLIYRFAFDYTDRNRENLLVFDSASDFVADFNISPRLLREFRGYLNEHDIKIDEAGFSQSQNLIEAYIKAYIGRNVYGNEAFFPVINQNDNMIREALKVLSKDDFMAFMFEIAEE